MIFNPETLFEEWIKELGETWEYSYSDMEEAFIAGWNKSRQLSILRQVGG